MSLSLFKSINGLNYDKAHPILKDISDSNVESLFFEVVEMRKHYKGAYNLLLFELNRRKSMQIETIDMEHCAALFGENVAAKEKSK